MEQQLLAYAKGLLENVKKQAGFPVEMDDIKVHVDLYFLKPIGDENARGDAKTEKPKSTFFPIAPHPFDVKEDKATTAPVKPQAVETKSAKEAMDDVLKNARNIKWDPAELQGGKNDKQR
jgi:hypothetical protein